MTKINNALEQLNGDESIISGYIEFMSLNAYNSLNTIFTVTKSLLVNL